MNGRRTEQQHFTLEQVRGHLVAALELVDDLEVPEDLRAAAFVKVYDSLSAKQIVVEQIAPGLPAMHVPRL